MTPVNHSTVQEPTTQEVVAAPIPLAFQGNTPTEPAEAQQPGNIQVPHGIQAHPPQNILVENHPTAENAENIDEIELVPTQGSSSLHRSLYGWVPGN